MQNNTDIPLVAPRFTLKANEMAKIRANTKLCQGELLNRIEQVKSGTCKLRAEAIAYLLGKYIVYVPASCHKGVWNWSKLKFHSAYDTADEGIKAEQTIHARYNTTSGR